MTQCTVMCISKKIKEFLKSKGWKKTETFNPGEELLKIEKLKMDKTEEFIELFIDVWKNGISGINISEIIIALIIFSYSFFSEVYLQNLLLNVLKSMFPKHQINLTTP